VQQMVANGARNEVRQLYNVGLSEAGEVLVDSEKGPGGLHVMVKRDALSKKTAYEIKIPASALELEALEEGMHLGIGICVNDGDHGDGQQGQKGWSGWGPHSIVFGKSPELTGLVTLSYPPSAMRQKAEAMASSVSTVNKQHAMPAADDAPNANERHAMPTADNAPNANERHAMPAADDPSVPAAKQSDADSQVADGAVETAAPAAAESDTFEDEEAKRLRTECTEKEKALRAAEAKVEAEQGKIDGDYGANDVFYKLKGECFTLQLQQYVYELCPFRSAKQGSTLLGSWDSWETDYTAMRYKGGEHCWNAGAREATVQLRCGLENKLISVNEPATCRYALMFETPAACDSSRGKALRSEAEKGIR